MPKREKKKKGNTEVRKEYAQNCKKRKREYRSQKRVYPKLQKKEKGHTDKPLKVCLKARK